MALQIFHRRRRRDVDRFGPVLGHEIHGTGLPAGCTGHEHGHVAGSYNFLFPSLSAALLSRQAGTRKEKRAPCPGAVSHQIRPPSDSTKSLATANPYPVVASPAVGTLPRRAPF